jgi:Holliday junction resolvase RusA-like endonuclease
MTQRSKYADPAAQRYLTYKKTVATAALQIRGRPLPWANVGILITVYLCGKGGKLPGRRGDWDNYAKGVCDGLQDAGVFVNDKAVTAGALLIRPCTSEAEERVGVLLFEDDLSPLANNGTGRMFHMEPCSTSKGG